MTPELDKEQGAQLLTNQILVKHERGVVSMARSGRRIAPQPFILVKRDISTELSPAFRARKARNGGRY